MKLILLGAPGSGKGTLAKKITRDFDIPQISTGDMFRQFASEGGELGLKLKSYMDSGKLVPDEVTIEILKARISKADCKKGFILDGFPRTIPQANALKTLCEIDSVILVDLAFEEIIKRLVSRRVCSSCGDIDNSEYEGYTGNCRKCGTKLFQRDDDKLETVKNRLEVYEKNTAPLINFYSDRLFKVSSKGTPEETYEPVKTFLENLED